MSEQSDWIETLREQCRRHGSKEVGDEIGYSKTVISQVLNGKYPGNLAKVEDAVRGAYLGKCVACPVLGELARNRCLEHQQRPFATTNPTRVKLFRACRSGCPHSQLKAN